MRLLKVRMLDGAIKSMMVDDSQIVSNMMVIICTKIGITNHDEYSLVREKTEDEQENQTPNKKYGTLGTIGGTLTLKRKQKNVDSDEPQIDPKMATLRKNLHTEDGGRLHFSRRFLQLSHYNFPLLPGDGLSGESRSHLFPLSSLLISAASTDAGEGLMLVVTSFFLQSIGWTTARHSENRGLTRRRSYC